MTPSFDIQTLMQLLAQQSNMLQQQPRLVNDASQAKQGYTPPAPITLPTVAQGPHEGANPNLSAFLNQSKINRLDMSGQPVGSKAPDPFKNLNAMRESQQNHELDKLQHQVDLKNKQQELTGNPFEATPSQQNTQAQADDAFGQTLLGQTPAAVPQSVSSNESNKVVPSQVNGLAEVEQAFNQFGNNLVPGQTPTQVQPIQTFQPQGITLPQRNQSQAADNFQPQGITLPQRQSQSQSQGDLPGVEQAFSQFANNEPITQSQNQLPSLPEVPQASQQPFELNLTPQQFGGSFNGNPTLGQTENPFIPAQIPMENAQFGAFSNFFQPQPPQAAPPEISPGSFGAPFTGNLPMELLRALGIANQ